MFNSIRLQFVPSYSIAALISAPGIAATSIFATRDFPLWLIIILILLTSLINIYYLCLLAGLHLKQSVIEITLTSQQTVLHNKNGLRYPVNIKSDYFISRYFCLVSLASIQIPFKTRYVIICRWNVQSLDDFRRLRVLIKHSRLTNNRFAL